MKLHQDLEQGKEIRGGSGGLGFERKESKKEKSASSKILGAKEQKREFATTAAGVLTHLCIKSPNLKFTQASLVLQALLQQATGTLGLDPWSSR